MAGCGLVELEKNKEIVVIVFFHVELSRLSFKNKGKDHEYHLQHYEIKNWPQND